MIQDTLSVPVKENLEVSPEPLEAAAVWVPAAQLRPWARNPRKNEAAVAQVADSIRRFGFGAPLLARRANGEVIAGHTRLKAALALGLEKIPVRYLDLDPADAHLLALADNRLGEIAEWDDSALAGILAELKAEEADLTLGTGFTDAELEALLAEAAAGGAGAGSGAAQEQAAQTLAERFGVPPFSVLDGRQGYWRERKAAWLALGIQSELGRGQDSAPGGSLMCSAKVIEGKIVRGDSHGRPLSEITAAASPGAPLRRHSGPLRADGSDMGTLSPGRNGRNTDGACADGTPITGTSVFDPVLCELAYRWLAPRGGAVLDPFAGGSVRGIVASRLGLAYTGIDLSAAQLEANRAQAERLCKGAAPRIRLVMDVESCPALLAPLSAAGEAPEAQGEESGAPGANGNAALAYEVRRPAPPAEARMPLWIEGDSREAERLAPGEYDLVFSCPPYGDLERYSEDPRDLSTLAYPEFLAAYREIIAASVRMLRADRFAAFCVGDYREQEGGGCYRNFVSETISAFAAAGARLYNEAIFVTPAGSLPIRAGKQFSASRKLGKTHQNLLVFVKGDPRRAARACGEIEVTIPEDELLAGSELGGAQSVAVE
jgi:hypothetical protein